MYKSGVWLLSRDTFTHRYRPCVREPDKSHTFLLPDACRRRDEKTRGVLYVGSTICILLEEMYANLVSVYCHQRNELQIEMPRRQREKYTRCVDRQLSSRLPLQILLEASTYGIIHIWSVDTTLSCLIKFVLMLRHLQRWCFIKVHRYQYQSSLINHARGLERLEKYSF